MRGSNPTFQIIDDNPIVCNVHDIPNGMKHDMVYEKGLLCHQVRLGDHIVESRDYTTAVNTLKSLIVNSD